MYPAISAATVTSYSHPDLATTPRNPKKGGSAKARNRENRSSTSRHSWRQRSSVTPRHQYSHIRAMCSLACHLTPNIEFLFWREGRELQDSIEVALPETYARIPVAPDGFFGLRDAKGRLYFFDEADRGTMTVKRFTLKLMAYAAYSREKKHEEKFGIKKFRVLTVTSSAARQRNLVASAKAAENLRDLERMFLFTSEQKLPLARPTGHRGFLYFC